MQNLSSKGTSHSSQGSSWPPLALIDALVSLRNGAVVTNIPNITNVPNDRGLSPQDSCADRGDTHW